MDDRNRSDGADIMAPTALLAGRLSDRWDRMPLLAVAFWALPVKLAEAWGPKPTPSQLSTIGA